MLHLRKMHPTGAGLKNRQPAPRTLSLLPGLPIDLDIHLFTQKDGGKQRSAATDRFLTSHVFKKFPERLRKCFRSIIIPAVASTGKKRYLCKPQPAFQTFREWHHAVKNGQVHTAKQLHTQFSFILIIFRILTVELRPAPQIGKPICFSTIQPAARILRADRNPVWKNVQDTWEGTFRKSSPVLFMDRSRK